MNPITVLLAGPDREFRAGLRNVLAVGQRFDLCCETGRPDRLRVLVSGWRPDLLVFESVWLAAVPELLSDLVTDSPETRVVLAADSYSAPEVLAAVEQGVRGCLMRSSTSAEWRRALLGVHGGEVWIPRWLLTEALSDLQQLLPTGWLPTAAQLERQTERQREILRWVAQGLSNKEIGRRLGISPTTVKTHLHNIFERVGVSGRQRILAQVVPMQSVG